MPRFAEPRNEPPAGRPSSLRLPDGLRQVEQDGHALVALDGMPKVLVAADHVMVPPTVPLSREIPPLLELADDALHGPLGESDHLRDVPHARLGLVGEAYQDVGVVREEGPRRSLGVVRSAHHDGKGPSTTNEKRHAKTISRMAKGEICVT